MAKNVLNVKDKTVDEDELIESGQPESFEVQTRGFLDNVGADYGLSASDLGWKDGNILINGNPFTTADRVQDGISFVDNEKIKADWDKYIKTYSLTSNKEKYDLGNYGYDDDPYDVTMKELLDKVLNPTPFNYTAESDPSFQSYKEQYGRAGDRALTNTMSEATGLTGGRLNSWAVSAGQQAKENFDQKLMDIIPQLENLAYNRYQDGIDNTRNNLNTLIGVDNEEYRRAYDSRAFDYGVDFDTKAAKTAAENTAYERAEDEEDDAQKKIEWELEVGQDQFNNEMDTKELEQNKLEATQANARGWASINQAAKNYDLSVDEFEWKKEKDLAELEQKAQDVEDKFLLGTIYEEMMNLELTDLDGLPTGKAENAADWLTKMASEIPEDIFKVLWPYANQKETTNNYYINP